MKTIQMTLIEPKQRAHSPLLATGLASELKIDAIPYGRRFSVACCGDLQSLISLSTECILYKKNGSSLFLVGAPHTGMQFDKLGAKHKNFSDRIYRI